MAKHDISELSKGRIQKQDQGTLARRFNHQGSSNPENMKMNLENQAVERYYWTDLLPLSKSMTVPQANPKF